VSVPGRLIGLQINPVINIEPAQNHGRGLADEPPDYPLVALRSTLTMTF